MKVLEVGHQGLLARELRHCLTLVGYVVVGRGSQVWALREQPISEGCRPMSSLIFSSTLLPTHGFMERNRSPMVPWRSIGTALGT